MKTLHVVGYKNSGKTTLISRWVRLLKKLGWTVAVLKHHGHGSPLDMPNSTTDTMQFFANGADVSVVSGGGSVQLLMNEEPDFTRMKEIAVINNPDILLIEGYKEEKGKKVVLLRNERDWDGLRNLHDIELVVGLDDFELNTPQVPSRINHEKLDQWLLNWIKKEDRHL